MDNTKPWLVYKTITTILSSCLQPLFAFALYQFLTIDIMVPTQVHTWDVCFFCCSLDNLCCSHSQQQLFSLLLIHVFSFLCGFVSLCLTLSLFSLFTWLLLVSVLSSLLLSWFTNGTVRFNKLEGHISGNKMLATFKKFHLSWCITS